MASADKPVTRVLIVDDVREVRHDLRTALTLAGNIEIVGEAANGLEVLMILLQVFVFGLLQTGEFGPVWPIDVIHFWFVQHLLLYSLGYALWRGLRREAAKDTVRPTPPRDTGPSWPLQLA